MAMRVLYAKMDKLVDKKILERLLPRAASLKTEIVRGNVLVRQVPPSYW